MGGHRGGRSKTKRLCNSPPFIEPTVKKGRQRSTTASPVLDEESLSGESYFSDSTSASSLSNAQTALLCFGGMAMPLTIPGLHLY